ncbi:MAG: hypothetical protein ABI647_00245 [Gemmatimonadota bacterium]
MAVKLSSRQQAQVAVLETFPPRMETIHRLIEEIAGLRADEQVVRRLGRTLDEMKAGASGMGLGALAETCGMMAIMSRRGGGIQMKVRGLREGLASLKVNFDGAMRSATTPEKVEEKPPAKPGSSP